MECLAFVCFRCPVAQLEEIYSILNSFRLKSLLHKKGIVLESVELQTRPDWPLCDSRHMQQAMGLTPPPEIVSHNYPPSIKNAIDQIEGFKGEYLLYKVPTDFCYDPEDGDTPR